MNFGAKKISKKNEKFPSYFCVPGASFGSKTPRGSQTRSFNPTVYGGGWIPPPSRFFPSNFFSGSPLALIFAGNSQNFLREPLVKELFRLHRYFFRYRAFVEGCRKVPKLACLKPWITKLVIFSVLLHKMN